MSREINAELSDRWLMTDFPTKNLHDAVADPKGAFMLSSFQRVVLAYGAFGMLAACQMPAKVASAPAPAGGAAAHRLAQSACGGCHSVEAYGLSPNPASPAFAEIANRPGLTGETLTSWLRDAHNYPEEMKLSLEEDEVRLLTAHINSLRRAGYQPPNQ